MVVKQVYEDTMFVWIVISKKTNHIMAVYSNYSVAAKEWSIEQYDIRDFPVLSN